MAICIIRRGVCQLDWGWGLFVIFVDHCAYHMTVHFATGKNKNVSELSAIGLEVNKHLPFLTQV